MQKKQRRKIYTLLLRNNSHELPYMEEEEGKAKKENDA